MSLAVHAFVTLVYIVMLLLMLDLFFIFDCVSSMCTRIAHLLLFILIGHGGVNGHGLPVLSDMRFRGCLLLVLMHAIISALTRLIHRLP